MKIVIKRKVVERKRMRRMVKIKEKERKLRRGKELIVGIKIIRESDKKFCIFINLFWIKIIKISFDCF